MTREEIEARLAAKEAELKELEQTFQPLLRKQIDLLREIKKLRAALEEADRDGL